jgi:hypothetical protein
MRVGIRGISRWGITVGVVLVVGAQVWVFAGKGPKISVGDDPAMKEGSPELVLVEISDFQ